METFNYLLAGLHSTIKLLHFQGDDWKLSMHGKKKFEAKLADPFHKAENFFLLLWNGQTYDTYWVNAVQQWLMRSPTGDFTNKLFTAVKNI